MTRPAINGTRRNGTVRCAIYTRKSSEEGLEQEFNSLQAQREACEAFITSQRQEGWVCLHFVVLDIAHDDPDLPHPPEQPAHRLLPSRSKLSTPLISAARAECVHVRMENEL